MQYWEEMNSKWGFGDGDAVPVGAEVYRDVYIQAVNTIAEEMGSNYRLEAYDRPGMHNWCLILRVNIGQTLEESLQVPERTDNQLDAAIDLAMDLNLDDYVETRVRLKKAELNDLLTNLVIPGDEEDQRIIRKYNDEETK